MKTEWKDDSTYSQRDTVREIKTVSVNFASTRLTVTRKHWHPDVWYVVCHDLNLENVLESKDLEGAKTEAIAAIRTRLTQMLEALP